MHDLKRKKSLLRFEQIVFDCVRFWFDRNLTGSETDTGVFCLRTLLFLTLKVSIRIDNIRESRDARGNISPTATVSAANPTWIGLESNPGPPQ